MNGHIDELQVGHHTHPGPRESNQDGILTREFPDGRWLVALADGMGGLKDGERASQLALQALAREVADGSTLVEAVQRANAAVYAEGQSRTMGTTLVAALLGDRGAEIAHVGDSRAYHLDPLGLVQVTSDHTLAQEADAAGQNHELEGVSGRWGTALARFLGADATVEVEHHGPFDLHQGGWLLLCSDGLHGVLSPTDLEECLRSESDPNQAARRLVAAALDRHTEDNVSVALVVRTGGEKIPVKGRSSAEGREFWDPEALLTRSPRTSSRRRRRRLFTIVFVTLIAVVTVLLLLWMGAGSLLMP